MITSTVRAALPWHTVWLALALGSIGCGGAQIAPGGGSADQSAAVADLGGDPDADAPYPLDVEPSTLQTIVVAAGAMTPTVTFTATLNGTPTNVGWSLDRADIGSIVAGPSTSGTFTPSGTTGGLVTISAGVNQLIVRRQVFVQLTAEQNGPSPAEAGQVATTVGQLGTGGGIGGVGGEGLGPAVADPATLNALKSPSPPAMGLVYLYPYDKTVFPRGMLAPLLMWSWAPADADAVLISLQTTSKSFSYTGTFGRPAILGQTGGAFIRHPIPDDVWAMATNSAGGTAMGNAPDQLTVSLTVAKGGKAYGPLSETFTIAPARLAGTVYYNSYGTRLVANSTDLDHNQVQYGAAVLGIRSGDTSPTVVAGTKSGLDGSGCRVCHVVSASGNRLIAQHGEAYARTSSYELKNGNAETPLVNYDGLFGWAGLSPDGTMALTNAVDLAASAPTTALYAFPPVSKVPLAATGLPMNLQAGTPTFSPDGKHVSFEFVAGTLGGMTGNGTQLVAMDFDVQTLAFGNLTVLATMAGGMRAGFPSFLPTNDAVAFHYQLVNSNHRYNTWHGAKAQIWWSDLKTGKATPLAALNGFDAGTMAHYLPTGPNNHADDTVLNYEPTVNPIASGGYAWVIFTSRRLYGNVATADPWQSDPRSYDVTNLANTTCKKLWVAAVDLNAAPGTDPSHPAFYLPAQELLAGNARGFWVLDPCRPDGQPCSTGDQCCNGFCEPAGPNGALICTNAPTTANCSKPQEKCTTSADCCDPTNQCINGFCSYIIP